MHHLVLWDMRHLSGVVLDAEFESDLEITISLIGVIDMILCLLFRTIPDPGRCSRKIYWFLLLVIFKPSLNQCQELALVLRSR